jgi:hypothetical protein
MDNADKKMLQEFINDHQTRQKLGLGVFGLVNCCRQDSDASKTPNETRVNEVRVMFEKFGILAATNHCIDQLCLKLGRLRFEYIEKLQPGIENPTTVPLETQEEQSEAESQPRLAVIQPPPSVPALMSAFRALTVAEMGKEKLRARVGAHFLVQWKSKLKQLKVAKMERAEFCVELILRWLRVHLERKVIERDEYLDRYETLSAVITE